MPEGVAPDPSRSAEIIAELTQLLGEARSSGKPHLAAMGEFGLDYDRLHYCSKSLQLHSFAAQLDVAASLDPQLPLFLHSRAAHADFVALLKSAFGDGLEKLQRGGVVHSFTGTVEEMRELVGLGLHIGINGCSLKTVENCDVVREIPLDKLMLETDGPWCEVRPSHEGYKYLLLSANKNDATEAPSTSGSTPTSGDSRAQTPQTPQQQQQQQRQKKNKNQKAAPDVAQRYKVVKKEKWEEGAMVKGRNEPCSIERVATIVAGIKGVAVEQVCEAVWKNTVQVFELGENVIA
jgi:TatD DNase family protein